MKIKIEDLKRVVDWMNGHSPDVMCDIKEVENGLMFVCKDRYATHVEIKVTREGNMGPRIIKEESLP